MIPAASRRRANGVAPFVEQGPETVGVRDAARRAAAKTDDRDGSPGLRLQRADARLRLVQGEESTLEWGERHGHVRLISRLASRVSISASLSCATSATASVGAGAGEGLSAGS